MTTNIPYIASGRSVTAFVNNKTYTANNTHPNFRAITDALKAGVKNVTEFVSLFDIVKSIESNSGGKVSIKGDTVLYDGNPVHSTLTDRMLTMIAEGFDVTPMINFMENLYQNPSYRCVNSVYDFLAANNVPITPDGHALMYKKVRGDYLDIHSRTFDNSVGKVLEVPRNQVDENIDQTCSYGLHVCAEGYLQHFGSGSRETDRVVICKVNPRDIVANPRDYNNAKLRVCRYEVVGEVPQDQTKNYFRSPVMTGTESWDVSRDIEDEWDNDSKLDYYDEYDNDGDENDDGPVSTHIVVIAGVPVTFVNEVDDEWSVVFVHPDNREDSRVTSDTLYGDTLDEVLDVFKDTYIYNTRVYLVEVRGFNNTGDVVDKVIEVEEEVYEWSDDPMTIDDFRDDSDLYMDQLESQAEEIDSRHGVFVRSVVVGEVRETWA